MPPPANRNHPFLSLHTPCPGNLWMQNDTCPPTSPAFPLSHAPVMSGCVGGCCLHSNVQLGGEQDEKNSINDSPITKACEHLMPTKAKECRESKQKLDFDVWSESNGKKVKLGWKVASDLSSDGEGNMCSRTVRKLAEMMENLLSTLTSRSAELAGDVLLKLIERVPDVKEKVVCAFVENEADSVEHNVASGVKSFIAHHSTKGGRKTVVQNAVNAVVTAALFDKEDSVSMTSFSNFLGVKADELLAKAHSHGQKMKEEKSYFSFVGREQWSDCVTKETRHCVFQFCHSDYGSRVDTNSKWMIPVLGLVGKKEYHPQRNWYEVGEYSRYQRFCHSIEYSEFKKENPGCTISATTFCQHVCKCCIDPTDASCVDIIYSKIDHFQRGVLSALQEDFRLKSLADNCDCEVCIRANAVSAEPGDKEAVHWRLKQLLKVSPEMLVCSLCCEKAEHPDLCPGPDLPTPKLLKWKCAKGTCSNCGLSNKLNILQCKALNECDIEIPVKIWSNADHDGKREQLELTQKNLQLKEVLSLLKGALEELHMHYAWDRFLRCIQKIHEWLSDSQTLLIKCDYSATASLRASQTDNCSKDNHAVLEVRIIVHFCDPVCTTCMIVKYCVMLQLRLPC